MKAQIVLIICIASLLACQPAEDYKIIRKEIVEEHDKVMIDSERAIEDRTRLENLLLNLDSLKSAHPVVDTLKEKVEISKLVAKLDEADQQMETWMKEFDAELGKKSNDEAVAYFKNEKLKLKQLDSLIKDALGESEEYLRKY